MNSKKMNVPSTDLNKYLFRHIREIPLHKKYYSLCGAWTAINSSHSLLVRTGDGNLIASLYGTDKLYKEYIDTFLIYLHCGQLVFHMAADEDMKGQIEYYPDTGILLFGDWGLFEPEENTLIRHIADGDGTIIAEHYDY